MKAINVTKLMKAVAELTEAQDDLNFAVKYGRKQSRIDELTAVRDEKSEEANKLMAVLENAIKEAEGRASARRITAGEIIDELTDIQKGLNIPKKSMVGIKVEIDINAQNFPRSYKYTPESTWFCAEYTSSGWMVTNIFRDITARYNAKYSIKLTDEAKTQIINNYEHNFRKV